MKRLMGWALAWLKLRQLRDDQCGNIVVEFALISGALVVLTLGSIEVGLLLWTTNVLAGTAALTARCVAIGGAACPSGPSYAVNMAGSAMFTGAIETTEVSVQSDTSCNGVPGSYVVVTITAHHWTSSALIVALSRNAIVASACYPVST